MKNLQVMYMINGLIYVGNRIGEDHNGAVTFKNVLAFAPGPHQGSMNLMPAFPFTDMEEVVRIERGTYIAITELDDEKVRSTYNDAVRKMSAQKSGLILP